MHSPHSIKYWPNSTNDAIERRGGMEIDSTCGVPHAWVIALRSQWEERDGPLAYSDRYNRSAIFFSTLHCPSICSHTVGSFAKNGNEQLKLVECTVCVLMKTRLLGSVNMCSFCPSDVLGASSPHSRCLKKDLVRHQLLSMKIKIYLDPFKVATLSRRP